MAKGDILKTALQNPNNGPHQKAVIRSAIYEEMKQFTAVKSLPPTLSASEICSFLAPIERHLTQNDRDQLELFADFLAVVDNDPSARPGYQLMGAKFSFDIGL